MQNEFFLSNLAGKINLLKSNLNNEKYEIKTLLTYMENELKPRYLILVSAIIKLTTMAGSVDNKTPVLVIETRATDSMSGKILRMTVTTISGKKFRQEVYTPAAKAWVNQAITYANSPEKFKN